MVVFDNLTFIGFSRLVLTMESAMNGLTRVFRNKVKNKAGISNTFLKSGSLEGRDEVSARLGKGRNVEGKDLPQRNSGEDEK